MYQLSTALLEALVLAVIDGGDAYGYVIAQQLKTLATQKESALYPVLKRLQAEGMLTTYDQAFQGRNRRYYRITEEGKKQLAFYRQEWESFKTAADEIFDGGKE